MMKLRNIIFVLLFTISNGCMQQENPNTDAILKKAESLMDIDGVEGVSIGEEDGKPCLYILNSVDSSQLSDQVPDTFEGLKVVYQNTGVINIQDDADSIGTLPY